MGYIKEPVGVDLNISPMPFSDKDRQEISAIIAHYKSTGEIPKPMRKPKPKRRKSASITNNARKRTKSARVKKKSTVSQSDKL